MGASRGKPPNALRAKGVEKEEEEVPNILLSTLFSNSSIYVLPLA